MPFKTGCPTTSDPSSEPTCQQLSAWKESSSTTHQKRAAKPPVPLRHLHQLPRSGKALGTAAHYQRNLQPMCRVRHLQAHQQPTPYGLRSLWKRDRRRTHPSMRNPPQGLPRSLRDTAEHGPNDDRLHFLRHNGALCRSMNSVFIHPQTEPSAFSLASPEAAIVAGFVRRRAPRKVPITRRAQRPEQPGRRAEGPSSCAKLGEATSTIRHNIRYLPIHHPPKHHSSELQASPLPHQFVQRLDRPPDVLLLVGIEYLALRLACDRHDLASAPSTQLLSPITHSYALDQKKGPAAGRL